MRNPPQIHASPSIRIGVCQWTTLLRASSPQAPLFHFPPRQSLCEKYCRLDETNINERSEGSSNVQAGQGKRVFRSIRQVLLRVTTSFRQFRRVTRSAEMAISFAELNLELVYLFQSGPVQNGVESQGYHEEVTSPLCTRSCQRRPFGSIGPRS